MEKRVYTEKNYFTKKQGGGGYFKWIDMKVGNEIQVSFLHAMGEGKKGITPPKAGSGSGSSYSLKEAKELVKLLSEGIKFIEKQK